MCRLGNAVELPPHRASLLPSPHVGYLVTATPALAIENLHVRYGSVPVLRGIDLTVAAGGCTAVLGPSGCGKSTLLRAIAGLTKAHDGRIEIGESLTDSPHQIVAPEKRNVALVFQDLALWPHMTVEGNLDFVFEARGLSRADRGPETLAALAAVGLPTSLGRRYPAELSGGERQRAAMARAIAQKPRILLLDEPLTGLDRHLRRHLLETLARLRGETGLAMLVVTHDQEEAFALADQVAVMNAGVIEQAGPPETVYEAPRTAFVAGFVGPAALVPSTVSGATANTPLGRFPADGVADGAHLAVFRPAGVRVVAEGQAASEIGARGCVETAFYRGGHFLLVVLLAEGDQRVLVHSETKIACGTVVALEADGPAFVGLEAVRSEAT